MAEKKTAVLLVGHGSSESHANDSMLQVLEIIRKKKNYSIIEAAFLELSPPFIPEVIQTCINKGAEEILVVPYFLNRGRHIRRGIPQIIREEAQKHPNIVLRFGNAINFHPLLAEIITDRISETEKADDIRDTIVQTETNEKPCAG